MRLLILVMSFLLFSCNKISLNEQDVKPSQIYILNKLDLHYYPAFTDLLGVEVDFEKAQLKIYNPAIGYNYVKLDSFRTHISVLDLNKVDYIVRSISCDELENPKAGYGLDGMHLEAAFYFADGSIFHNSPGNMPIKKYEDLSKMILEIVLKYNKSQNNEKVIEKIKEYY